MFTKVTCLKKVTITAFWKCFNGAGYIKVGGSLGSEGMLWIALRVWTCRRVPNKKISKFWCSRMPWQGMLQDAVVWIQIICLHLHLGIIRAFFCIKQKKCATLAIHVHVHVKQLLYNPTVVEVPVTKL